MIKPVTLASVFAVLVAASGCGATLADGHASTARDATPRHQWSDGDWYAQAIEEARTPGAGVAFHVQLEQSLDRYGLTMRGLRVYSAHHPERAEAAEALYDAARAERLVAPLEAAPEPDTAAGLLATRD